MKSLKAKYYSWRIARRYKKFKNCSLPCRFWDKKRDTFEWVYYDVLRQGGFDIQNSLYEALGNVSSSGVTYEFEAFMYGRNNPDQKEAKYQMIKSHCHSFDEVVGYVYEYPESFRIPEDCLGEYSQQELCCLRKMQSYLKAIGLKDEKKSLEIVALNEKWEEINNKKKKSLIDRFFLFRYLKKWEKLNDKEKLNRCRNEKALLYSSYRILHTNKNGIADAYLNGEKDYILNRKYSFDKKTNVGIRFMLENENNEYCGTLEVISEEFVPFKDLKEEMVDYKLAGYKTFSDYKEHLYNKYLDDERIYQEKFSEDSLLVYLKVKVLEKF